MDDLENARENQIDFDNLNYDDRVWEQDLELLKSLDADEQKRKDSFYSKRSKRESIRRRGGIRQESPFFDDD